MGIGTTAPLDKLHIGNYAAGGGIRLESRDTAIGSAQSLGQFTITTTDSDVITNKMIAQIDFRSYTSFTGDAARTNKF